MDSYLIFRLYGSMCSWGDVAIGGVRPSHRYPTKSSIMGLIAAALGITREEEETLQSLQNETNFGVRVDNEGILVIDYHTTQAPSRSSLKNWPKNTRRDELLVPKLETILSTREYYCDAIYTIVLWQHSKNSSFDLGSIERALKNPTFVLYLGRKSCPICIPIKPVIVSANNIEHALKNADETILKNGMDGLLKPLVKTTNPTSIYWENEDDANKSDSNYHDRRTRKDTLKNRRRWQYSDREEYYKIITALGD